MAERRNDLRYDYTGDRRLLEGADWFGTRPSGLQTHFHFEVQVSILWEGLREYVVGSRRVTLRPSGVLVIPSMTPHCALPSMASTLRSAEFYIDPQFVSLETRKALENCSYFLLDRPDFLELEPGMVGRSSSDVAGRVLDFLCGALGAQDAAESPARMSTLEQAMAWGLRVSHAAEATGYSREGFIRAFRREVGLTPHAYRVNRRLNEARRLLRDGEAIADIAHAMGFSDQSHFGRAFLSHFGATPGHFRSAHKVR